MYAQTRRVKNCAVRAGFAILFAAIVSTCAYAAETKEKKPSDLTAVRQLLAEKCLACHGGDKSKIEGEFDLRTRAAALAGGESGEASLVPGKPDRSRLLEAVRWTNPDFRMPPKVNDRLSEAQIALLEKWIDDGATWPDFSTGAAVAPSGQVRFPQTQGTSTDWTNRGYEAADVWGFLPAQNALPPAGTASHPIDRFIQQSLAAKKLASAPAADPRTLLRRLTFDLTGLPPTAEQAARFEQAVTAEAYASFVRELLASPRYGERMAQHWLDVVRYADTSGFSNDYERPHAWRYRDYVIRAFNADKPFDRFILEQIAGDELDAANVENLIAVGFLRMGPWEHTSMSVPAVTRQMWLDDVTSAVGLTFLGQNLTCCRCHDHKFDPLSIRDYYQIQAVFAGTQFAEREAPFLPEENRASFAATLDHAQRTHDAAGLKPLSEVRPNDDTFNRLKKKRDEYSIRALQRTQPKAFSVTNEKPHDVYILSGGMLESPREKVSPAMVSAYERAATPIDSGGASGERRLALARWIARRDHPATARVLVNRVWQMHFGRGLVATPNNFGKTGGRPSHPELLDFLAHTFVEQGWSLKKLHHFIVTSDVYRQAAEHPQQQAVRDIDPANQLLAYFPARRLSAEEMRDAALAISGELALSAADEPLGGPPVYPEINWEAALQPRHIMGGYAPSYLPSSTPGERHRRSIYAARIRTLSDPTLEVFNKPGSEFSCERRDETTVTPQVFAWFNGAFVHDRALALAVLLAKDHHTSAAQVTAAYQRVYGRSPLPAEVAAGTRHVEQAAALHAQLQLTPVELPQQVAREAIGEQSGQIFRWEERLNLAGYQRDVQPWQVAPNVRALAELCLVLLNSSEFLYVY